MTTPTAAEGVVIESRDGGFHARVRTGFLEEARRRPERIRVVDAEQSLEAIHQQICREVERVLERDPRP